MGHFSDAGAATCTPCGDGTYANSTGAATCALCLAPAGAHRRSLFATAAASASGVSGAAASDSAAPLSTQIVTSSLCPTCFLDTFSVIPATLQLAGSCATFNASAALRRDFLDAMETLCADVACRAQYINCTQVTAPIAQAAASTAAAGGSAAVRPASFHGTMVIAFFYRDISTTLAPGLYSQLAALTTSDINAELDNYTLNGDLDAVSPLNVRSPADQDAYLGLGGGEPEADGDGRSRRNLVGIYVLIGILAACLLAAVIACIVLRARRQRSAKAVVPFNGATALMAMPYDDYMRTNPLAEQQRLQSLVSTPSFAATRLDNAMTVLSGGVSPASIMSRPSPFAYPPFAHNSPLTSLQNAPVLVAQTSPARLQQMVQRASNVHYYNPLAAWPDDRDVTAALNSLPSRQQQLQYYSPTQALSQQSRQQTTGSGAYLDGTLEVAPLMWPQGTIVLQQQAVSPSPASAQQRMLAPQQPHYY